MTAGWFLRIFERCFKEDERWTSKSANCFRKIVRSLADSRSAKYPKYYDSWLWPLATLKWSLIIIRVKFECSLNTSPNAVRIQVRMHFEYMSECSLNTSPNVVRIHFDYNLNADWCKSNCSSTTNLIPFQLPFKLWKRCTSTMQFQSHKAIRHTPHKPSLHIPTITNTHDSTSKFTYSLWSPIALGNISI
jgi:hypothetical protein